MQRRFAIFDRDGTVIVGRNYLSDPAEVELLPGAARSLLQLKNMGFGLIIATNQSGIARGFFDLLQLEQIHARLRALLAAEGVELDAIYFCAHHPADLCGCRKPRTGMIDRASRELGFDPRASIVIGDNACDIELGQAVGARTILVRSGYGSQVEGTVQADYVVDGLSDAAALIHSMSEKECPREGGSEPATPITGLTP